MLSSNSTITLQSICTKWSKASRGGSYAYARNHTPEALLLPDFSLSHTPNTFFLHNVLYSERNYFQQPTQHAIEKPFTDPLYYDCLRLSIVKNMLHIVFEWERSRGTPRRTSFLRTTYLLQNEQWMRIVYNVRLANEESWEYRKYVFNLSFFSPSLLTTFLATKPSHIYKNIAYL
jgi:hypothetical protein